MQAYFERGESPHDPWRRDKICSTFRCLLFQTIQTLRQVHYWFIVLEDWNIWHRDNFIRIQSFTHFQFTAPRFRNLIRYAFYKAGYLSECPPKCETPINYCFKELGNYCSKEGCKGITFVRCADCECSLWSMRSRTFISDASKKTLNFEQNFLLSPLDSVSNFIFKLK